MSRKLSEGDTTFSSKYRLGEQLGTGAESIVYECWTTRGSERRAVKVTNRSKVDIRLLEEEYEVSKNLKHKNIGPCVGLHKEKDKVYTVMELIEGHELHDAVNVVGPMKEDCVIALSHQLISAVSYLHSNKICHRDIKPENLLITEEGVLKLIDFGLAYQLDNEQQTMRDSVGTQAYTAPEVLVGIPYTMAVDMWSVGATIYVMMAASKPFSPPPEKPKTPYKGIVESGVSVSRERTSQQEKSLMRARILNAEFDFYDSVWNSVSDNAKDFITKLLKIRPTDRMSSEDALKHPWLSQEIDTRSFERKWKGIHRQIGEDKRKTKREARRNSVSTNVHLDSDDRGSRTSRVDASPARSSISLDKSPATAERSPRVSRIQVPSYMKSSNDSDHKRSSYSSQSRTTGTYSSASNITPRHTSTTGSYTRRSPATTITSSLLKPTSHVRTRSRSTHENN